MYNLCSTDTANSFTEVLNYPALYPVCIWSIAQVFIDVHGLSKPNVKRWQTFVSEMMQNVIEKRQQSQFSVTAAGFPGR